MVPDASPYDASTDARPTLLAGVRAVPRDAHRLLVGSGTRRVEIDDTPAVRDMLADLACDIPVAPRDQPTRAALARLVSAGLTEPRSARSTRTAARGRARVLVDAPDSMAALATELLLATGIAVTSRAERATHALVAGAGEVPRHRLDRWMRRGVAHLLVIDHGRAVTVGPFVEPGRSCCVHCLDAHAAALDPGHAGLVRALAATTPLSPGGRPALVAAALAWAVDDVVSDIDGARPSTWSATLSVTSGSDGDRCAALSTSRRDWRRHPDCGCGWAEELRPDRAG